MSPIVHPIPDAALDDRLAWIGTSGSGKSYNASAAVERLLTDRARCAIVDPLGVWWGLRLNADGSPSKHNVVIFGGQHGDLPLNENAGALIGETVATMAESCIVDLSGLTTKSSERRFMLAFLDAVYRSTDARRADPYHIIFDEADLWAPQRTSEPMLQSRMEEIVRRGRIRGFIPWLITQRPAVLSKDVLSQADGLIAFKLTASQDRKAIGEWVKGQADEGQWARIDASLPTMQQGQGVVWVPARGLLATAQFPPKQTFDSSRTPKRGERREQRDLKPLNLAALKGKLATIEEEAKANDPKALKAEVARLSRELTAAERKVAKVPPVATSDNQIRADLAEARGQIAMLSKAIEDFNDRMGRVWERWKAPINEIMDAQNELFGTMSSARLRPIGRPNLPGDMTIFDMADRSALRRQAPTPIIADGSVPHGCAKPLAALAAVYPSGLTEAQWATSAGYKRTGGTWGAYKSRLRGAGLIEPKDGRWFATEAGAGAVGNIETLPPPGPDLVRWWASKLPGTSRMAEALIEAWPNALSKDELALRIDMAPNGGSFGAYLSRLAGPGLITRDGGVRLTEEVMGS